jgi:hypothetical protein
MIPMRPGWPDWLNPEGLLVKPRSARPRSHTIEYFGTEKLKVARKKKNGQRKVKLSF